MRPDLRSMRTLRLSSPAGSADDDVGLGPQQDRPVERPADLGLGHRVPGAAQRREALDELGDPGDGPAAQVGLVAGAERRDPVAERLLVVAERASASSTRSAGVGSPRQLSSSSIAWWDTLPQAMAGDQANGAGVEEVGLARQHLGDVELVDGERALVEALGELGERHRPRRRAARRRSRGRRRRARRPCAGALRACAAAPG